MDAYAAKSGVRLKVVLAVDSFRQAMQAAVTGVCAAVLPSVLLKPAAGTVDVVALPPALRCPTPYALAWRRRLVDTRRDGAAVVKALRQTLEGSRGMSDDGGGKGS